MKFLIKLSFLVFCICVAIWYCIAIGLRTDYAQQKIVTVLKKSVFNNKVDIEVSDLSISFPTNITAKSLKLLDNHHSNDTQNLILDAKNLSIDILPSIFSLAYFAISSLSIDELHLYKLLDTHSKLSDQNHDLISNIRNDVKLSTSVLIQDLAINKLFLKPNITNLHNDLILQLNSKINFNAIQQQLALDINAILNYPDIQILHNHKLGLNALIKLRQEDRKPIIDIKITKLTSDILNIVGDATITKHDDQFECKINYEASCDQKILSKYSSIFDSLNLTQIRSSGSIDLTKKLEVINIHNMGRLDFNLSANEILSCPSLKLENNITLHDKELSGVIKIEQDGINASGDIQYKDNKISLTNFQAYANEFTSNIDLLLDLNNLLMTGQISYNDHNAQISKKYFPFIKNGDITLNATYSASKNNKQAISMKGMVNYLSTKFGNVDNIRFDINSHDLFNLLLSPSNIKIKSLDISNTNIDYMNINIQSIDDFHKDSDTQITNITNNAHDTIYTKLYQKLQSLFAKNQTKLNPHKAFKTSGVISLYQSYIVDLKFNNDIYYKSNDKSTDIIVNMNKLSGILNNTEMHNASDIICVFGQDNYCMTQKFNIGNGFLNIAGKFDSDKLDIAAQIDRVPMDILYPILPNAFEKSVINGTIDISGTSIKPKLHSHLNVDNITLANKHYTLNYRTKHGKYFATQKNKTLTLKIISDINHNTSSINAELYNTSHTNNQKPNVISSLSCKIPGIFNIFPLEYKINMQEKFNAQLLLGSNYTSNSDTLSHKESNDDTDIDVDLLSLLPISHQMISGKVTGNLTIDNTLTNPYITGHIDLKDAQYEYPKYGISLYKISTNIKAKKTQLQFNNIAAHDANDHIISGTGAISTAAAKEFKFNLYTKECNIINSPYVYGFIKNGNISIIGDNSSAKLAGTLTLGPLTIQIPQNIIHSDIIELNIEQNTQDADQQIASDTSLTLQDASLNNKQYHDINNTYPIDLDIKLKTNDKVYIKGWGVNALLNGSLNISGSYLNPTINGTLRSLRGQYKEFGKILNITEGALQFNQNILPNIKIIGTTIVDSNEINVILFGAINNLELDITSLPIMSQERALSILLFGEGPDEISPIQALSLANSLNRLAGSGSDLDPLKIGSKLLRVDHINIKQDIKKSNQLSIGIGKYISDTIYLKLETKPQDHQTKATIEVQLLPKLLIEHSIEDTGEAYFGMQWKLDY